MTTIANLLARKQQLLQRLQEADLGEHERAGRTERYADFEQRDHWLNSQHQFRRSGT